jgi:O-antigen ligase
MIRLTLLWLLITFFSLYAFKDWFKSLCFLIILVAVVEHPDMPKTVFGIQGFNPWNILLFFVLLGWISNKRKEGLTWDLPKGIKYSAVLYVLIMVISFFRMMMDLGGLNTWFLETQGETPSKLSLTAEHFINTLKWIIPGILIYHGANTKERINYALIVSLGIYVLLALQIVKAMPLGVLADGEKLRHYSLKILPNNVGFHRVNLAMMMAGAFWAVYALKNYGSSKIYRLSIYFLCGVVLLGLALTGGRTGYATMVIIGLLLSFLKWRKNILLLPLILALVVYLFPGSVERFTQGFDEGSHDQASEAVQDLQLSSSDDVDYYTVTAGRTVIWPFVVDEIMEAPFIGYGKEAMLRNGVSLWLLQTLGEVFPHPHNAYMQWVMDNGIFGIIPVLVFYFIIAKISMMLFSEKDKYYSAIGGATLSLVLALLVAGVGSQTFYPREGAMAMWCMIGIMLRTYKNLQENKEAIEAHKPEKPKHISKYRF